MPKPDIDRKSRFLPLLGGPRQNIVITFITTKLDGETFEDFVYSF